MYLNWGSQLRNTGYTDNQTMQWTHGIPYKACSKLHLVH